MGKRTITHTVYLPSETVDEINWTSAEENVGIGVMLQEEGEVAYAEFACGKKITLRELEELVESLQIVQDNIAGLK